MKVELLKLQFQLPQNQFWRYLQRRHLLCTTFGSSGPYPLEKDWFPCVLEVSGRGNRASAFYLIFLKGSDKGPPFLKTAWETSLKVHITDSVGQISAK